MQVLRDFKSSQKLLCTCPPKYTINPYIGCSIGCVYCYGRYFSDFHKKSKKYQDLSRGIQKEVAIPREGLVEALKKEVKNRPKRLVYLSSIVDPYTYEEEKYQITREILKILVKNNFPINVQTKNPGLMLRDLDVLEKSKYFIASVTVTTLDKEKARKIEPYAPSPQKRLEVLKELSKKFLTTVWIDPIVPYLNDDEKELEELIKQVKEAGVKMITSGTLRIVWRYKERIEKALPEIKDKIASLYFTKPDRRYIYYYALPEYRYNITKKIRTLADKYKLGFGSCRTCPEFNTRVCDGSGYVLSLRLES
ncbi:MAG: radical SAM protein [Candidatus Aenigmatarchaeota archaeon]